ncbi:MAG: amino acid permease [Planctomycetes bacterium]|jgi:APA family basic amino acid/polyamine antiporter|nr:amino acid permease [Planctomycetota bacterium]
MASGQLQRRLGLVSAISITVGAVIGSGIFLTPLKAAQNVPSESWIYLLWVGLGIVCLFGAFAYAELGAMFPEAGGQYAFLREAWGKGVAFLYGWVFFWVINSGTVAALAVAFAEGILTVLGYDSARQEAEPLAVPGVAAAMIVALAVVNHLGVLMGAVLQNLATFAKVGALGLLVVGGVVAAMGSGLPSNDAPTAGASGLRLGGMVAAFTSIFWAYEGWYQLPFNAAELKRPERNLPLGLIAGMVLLIALYTAVNAVYLYAVPFGEMQALPATDKIQVPVLSVSRIFTPELAGWLTVLISISVMGAANPNFLSSPRAFYAMAQDGLVPAPLQRVSERWGTPWVSIWTQAVWSLLLVFVLRSFADITAFVVFAAFLFYALTVAGVYRLRARRPELQRPYRCTGYPVTPALFIAVSVAFVAALLYDPSERTNALYGLGILASGVPYYAWWVRRRPGSAS